PSKSIPKSAKVVKLPAIKPQTNFTKTELINLLKLAEIRKIIQEIVYKILENYESTPQEQPEVQKEYYGPMAMDIDVAQLENSKDLLAINGNVNGVNIQCLADSCANVSFIQEEACHELKLKADKSIKHSITGASGDSEMLGIVKNVSIELSPPQSGSCIIKEDLVVLKGYKHREIGLSRACLRRSIQWILDKIHSASKSLESSLRSSSESLGLFGNPDCQFAESSGSSSPQ
ncbi:hypothetical protein RclHR1_44220001, partial [Rhizophagus clarus]